MSQAANQQPSSIAYVKVALPVPLHRFFEYSVDKADVALYQAGCRVLVPFGKQQIFGIVIETCNSTEYDNAKIKPAIALIDTQAVFDEQSLSLARWIADFYLYPLGEVYSAMLPTLLRGISKTRLSSKGDADVLFERQLAHAPTENVLRGEVILDSEQLAALKKSKKQYQLYERLHGSPHKSPHNSSNKPAITLSQAKAEFSQAVIKGLVDKGFATQVSETLPPGEWQQKIVLGEKKRANTQQGIAIASINQADQYSAFLLDGVTGSGKTEVYLQIIEDVIKRGQQVLILVPEIGLTPQTVKRFEQRFGDIVAVWHSGLTDNERLNVWKQAKYNQVGIIIGTRSAVFLPIAKMGMIIVDEEHDDSFKQQDTLRYHARDVAAYRARQYQVSLVLGSATPSLESLHNALNKKFHHLQLTQRAGNASMPTQHLVDLTGVPLEAGIAPVMLKRIEQQLDAGNQVLIYVNRRGYAPALICQQCGHVETCEDCNHPFTLHLHSQNMQCHRCSKFQAYVPKCKKCHSTNINTQGIGTEQIHAFLSQRFTKYSSVRIDSDSTRGKKKLNNLLTDISQNKHQILVGTQILSKGHHFPNVTLALILNVDSFLFSSDFRAPEKLAQLVTQFSGRAGRADKAGEVWLQSFQVGHPLLQDLVNNGYEHFSRLLLQERISANLPPNAWQIALRVEHSDQDVIFNFMQFANQLLSQFKQLHYVGPFPAGVEKKQTRFRFITIAQSHSYQYVNRAMAQVQEKLSEHKLAYKVRWSVDVMPTDFS